MKLSNFDFSETSIGRFFENRSPTASPTERRASQEGHGGEGKFVSVTKIGRLPPQLLSERLKEEAMFLANNVKVKGLSKGLTVIPNKFRIRVENLNMKYLIIDCEGPGTVKLGNPSRINNSNYCEIDYKTDVAGEYFFFMEYRNQPIPGSPFSVKVVDNKKFMKNSAQVVKASGRGLRGARAGELAMFRVHLGRTGNKNGRLSVYVDTEDGKESHDVGYLYWMGGCTIFYSCPTAGKYDVRIKYNGKHIPGSPFALECTPPSPETWIKSTFVKHFTPGRLERREDKDPQFP